MLGQRERLRAELQRRRRDRDVQLGLRRDHRPGAQPGLERPDRDGQPGEHVRRPDAPGPGTAAGEPGKYYPTGKRNYVRVVAADDYQGAADALLAKSLGVKKVFILNDKEAYGLGVATNFKNAAMKLGIKVVGFTAWDGKATSYEALAVKIKSSGAQGMFLGGLICENGGKLIKDLRRVLPA